MAEGFEHYHVPQQSRRDKLRVFPQSQPGFVESSTTLHPTCPTLPSLYDPSLIPSDLLACGTPQGHATKEEGSNLMMGFAEGGVVNGDAIQFINSGSSNNPFLYHLQNLREFGDSYNDGSEMMVFKPEPLALSLSSHSSNTHHPLELNLQRYGGVVYGDKGGGGGGCVVPGLVGGNCEVLRNSVPLGPFTGYASILKGSRFLKPAHQLLEELCDVGVRGVYATEKIIAPDASLMEPTHEGLSASGIGGDDPLGEYGNEGKKKCRLLTMLDEVCRRYRQYYQQMHAVITSFEYVAGLGNAAPYASLAINAMSKHFRCLKNAITDQLQFINKAPFQISNRKDESPRFHNSDRGTYSQRPGFLEHQQPVWRPQRGLPERAVSVLRAWLFEHFLHPYPTDTDKLMLAKQTGLSRNQVSNWFINARVRLWKPMVEEIHTLESQQGQKRPHREEQSRKNLNDHLPSDNSLVTENPSACMEKFHDDGPYKHPRNELANIQVRNNQEQLNQSNTSNQLVGVGVSNNGVSLTLGLHQNHGIGLSEPFSMSAAQRFGVALQHEGYAISGFESHNRHFAGQLLHDFVG
ncbi:BEL1-like homeodomain protein 9 [Cajanus cajan]|uniref:BEL1-like homeodomain protein 9 n=1 Tax=Cajanus cajan TaxID=3821 RepID=A0A151RTR3_CAJCA|nr:BEL1-like homeodomain protein 9 [Cajanus cajan]KYP45932.1 BEL1-like homeodomain protein 9 [Cajanus cajan]